ncbi:NAD(P)-dependent oxidoreductase [Aquibium microcysteis]|uniref:NAD(P)-dependent oxidoreductase n=1 Tax=Aquibium microcysteis TaxID=675281 RepID=UPI001AEECC9C|nr:NAD(P)-dependent oxidoreductase [Aquibium microcysteis]
MERIGFVGIGNMGRPMSANLAKAGFPLTLYDASPQAARAHAATIDAAAAATTAELGAACDIVVTMLPTGRIVREVLLDGGLAAALKPGSLLIDMSSSDPIGSRDLGPALAEHGVGFVDAPVSGAVPRAIAGTLTIMLGSDDPALSERARPVLMAMGNRVFETGSLGTGHAMKALNNFVAAAGFAAVAEALVVAGRFGLDPKVAVEIMNVSTGRNFSTENVFAQHVLSGDFATGFALGLLAKDVGIAADLADAMGKPLPIVEETNRWWQAALDRLGGTVDHSAAFKAWQGED